VEFVNTSAPEALRGSIELEGAAVERSWQIWFDDGEQTGTEINIEPSPDPLEVRLSSKRIEPPTWTLAAEVIVARGTGSSEQLAANEQLATIDVACRENAQRVLVGVGAARRWKSRAYDTGTECVVTPDPTFEGFELRGIRRQDATSLSPSITLSLVEDVELEIVYGERPPQRDLTVEVSFADTELPPSPVPVEVACGDDSQIVPVGVGALWESPPFDDTVICRVTAPEVPSFDLRTIDVAPEDATTARNGRSVEVRTEQDTLVRILYVPEPIECRPDLAYESVGLLETRGATTIDVPVRGRRVDGAWLTWVQDDAVPLLTVRGGGERTLLGDATHTTDRWLGFELDVTDAVRAADDGPLDIELSAEVDDTQRVLGATLTMVTVDEGCPEVQLVAQKPPPPGSDRLDWVFRSDSPSGVVELELGSSTRPQTVELVIDVAGIDSFAQQTSPGGRGCRDHTLDVGLLGVGLERELVDVFAPNALVDDNGPCRRTPLPPAGDVRIGDPARLRYVDPEWATAGLIVTAPPGATGIELQMISDELRAPGRFPASGIFVGRVIAVVTEGSDDGR
jgi:hypothetical protein